jgi:hypothetical protein
MNQVVEPKREYQPPKFMIYGDLTDMTRTLHAATNSKDGPIGNNKS